MKLVLVPTLTALPLVLSSPAFAAEQNQTSTTAASSAAQPDPLLDENVIVVTSPRLPGQLKVEQPPVAELNAEDIAATGANSLADLLAVLEPETSSGARGSRGGGQPVILVNGIRIGSFREMRSYPPEAVAKVEVFPEEVAQRFGFSADQRVVNFVLKPNFRSLTAELEYEQPDRGGYSRNQQEATLLRIGKQGRTNLNVSVEDTSMLTEAERGLVVAGEEASAPFRSLVADTFSAQATANYARAFIESGTSLGFNATLGRDESLSLSGLDAAGEPLARDSRTNSLSLGASVNRPLGEWAATLTSDAVLSDSRTDIDRRDGSGSDRTQTRIATLVNKATLGGTLFDLPAGPASFTLDAGLDWKRQTANDSRIEDSVTITRRRLRGGGNLALPLTERGSGLGALGDISLSVGAGIENLSDFGTLTNWNAGVNWAPFDNLSFSATRLWREVAPSISQLGNPRIEEYNVPVFDPRRGEDALVTVITGGNPALSAETQADWKLGANWRLPFWKDARLQVDYGINTSRDVTATPAFTAAFEEAFPGRVSRGGDGELLAIDRRPLTLYQTRSKVLSFGLSARGSIGKEPERAERGGEGRPGSRGPGSPGGGERGGFGGGGMAMMFDPARFAALQTQLCAGPEGAVPDLSGLPEGLRARLNGADGQPDPARIAEMRGRVCGAAGEAAVAQMKAAREALCADPVDTAKLPPEMLARFKAEDGTIDQDRLARAKGRICAAPGSAPPESAGPRGAGGGGGGFGGRFGMMGGRDGDKRPRYHVSVNHTRALENEVLLAPGGPVFDQLDGEAISGGALSSDTSRLEGGLFWQGYGLRLSGVYTGEAVLRGGDAPGASDLFFGDLLTIDLRLFADLGEVLKKDSGWANGLRVALVADNLFDGRRSVVDETGTTPAQYDAFRIDPTGRYLGIDLRKAF